MTLDKIMSSPVVTVELDDSLKMVKGILDNAKFNHVLVVEHKKLIGIISDRDVYRVMSPTLGTPLETHKDVQAMNRLVHTFMTRKPITLRKTNNMFDAVELFLSHNISCIPIVDSENHIEGILTKKDILKLVKANRSKFSE